MSEFDELEEVTAAEGWGRIARRRRKVSRRKR